ncbi:hypothetical protein [Roseobacter sp. CCS2]|uniref:hypothetical protein n=1 Tax=Roseobacter sp. CCS2 TaxID=391593 RepID=UPI0000F40316|nr:hypothetical protein [Roseobacter sp. CCS2]EBA13714.1 hypothetical protein RCCS2_07494 [Roseobacter sp. CCS2]
MFRRLFGKDKSNTADTTRWNEIGRKVAQTNTAEITAFHLGTSQEPNLIEDTRTPKMAEAVLQKVIDLNNAGRGTEARAHFDPAHTPFISQMEQGGRGLTCCAILGNDRYLVQQGTTYQDNTTWLISGDEIEQVADIATFAWSRNRQFFVTVHQDGSMALGRTFADSEAERIPALPGSAFVPQDLSTDNAAAFGTPGDSPAYARVSVSDDGTKLLLCDAERGVVVLAKTASVWQSQLLFPAVDLGLLAQMKEFADDDDTFHPFFDMLHAALSPDGRYAALGTQDDGHHILALDADGTPHVFAHLGYLSEYPHNTCFSDDSQCIALNSCHFYNGVTFASTLAQVQGLTTEPYDQHDTQILLNTYLRVYASGYLPPSMTDSGTGAFLLAGSGFAACVTPDGKLLWEVGFGSSAGGVDICPATGRVLIASYSGMLHLLDPSQEQSPAICDGFHVPQEKRRWIFWDRLDRPILW